MMWRNIKLCWN